MHCLYPGLSEQGYRSEEVILMSDVNYNIYISGVGGQGIIKTSVIIGEAAMRDGYDCVMSEIHGMSQRGGSVSTELKIGNFKSSIVEKGKADMILSFEPIEVLRAVEKANENTAIIFNTAPMVPSTLTQTGETYPSIDGEIIPNLKENFNFVYPIEGNGLAKDAGSILSLNMVLLGAAVANDTFPLPMLLFLIIDFFGEKNNFEDIYL